MNTKNIINKVGYVFIGIGIFVVIIYIIGIYNIIITNNKLKEQSKVIEYYEETLITREVEVTYYNTGHITSMQEKPYEGSVAISPDLYEYFYPGEIVYIECGCVLDGYYRINDKTNSKFKDRVDVYTNKKINLDTGIWKAKINKIHYFVNLAK